jgi:hypothetical protein
VGGLSADLEWNYHHEPQLTATMLYATTHINNALCHNSHQQCFMPQLTATMLYATTHSNNAL